MSIDIERAAFEKWFHGQALITWRRTLTPDELDKPMPEGWSRGFMRTSWEAWQAARATPQAPTCHHRIADARNPYITSGYLCVDCGAVFSAADHDTPQTPTPAAAELAETYLQAKLKGDGWVEVSARQHAVYASAGTPVRTLYCYTSPVAAPLPRQAAVQMAQADTTLIADLYEFTKYAACSQRRNTGDFLDGLFKQIEDLQPRCAAAAPTVKASQ